MSASLIPYTHASEKRLAAKRLELRELQAELLHVEAEYKALRESLRQFESRYLPAVGQPYIELAAVREQVEKSWEALRDVKNGKQPRWKLSAALVLAARISEEPPVAFVPDDDLRRLFRELARLVHPDRASDSEDRERRHEFMAEATRAYRHGDAELIERLLEQWRGNEAPVNDATLTARHARVDRRIRWTRYRMATLDARMARMNSTAIADLMRNEEAARLEGRDLVTEMSRRVQQELTDAKRDLRTVRDAARDLDPATLRILRENAGFGAAV
jgi:hypothetical protein